MKFTIEEVKQLRSLLPRGYAKSLAKRTGFQARTIYNVLSGQQANAEILAAAIELAKANQCSKTQLRSDLHKLIKG